NMGGCPWVSGCRSLGRNYHSIDCGTGSMNRGKTPYLKGGKAGPAIIRIIPRASPVSIWTRVSCRDERVTVQRPVTIDSQGARHVDGTGASRPQDSTAMEPVGVGDRTGCRQGRGSSPGSGDAPPKSRQSKPGGRSHLAGDPE